jgi:hypothetical protein
LRVLQIEANVMCRHDAIRERPGARIALDGIAP